MSIRSYHFFQSVQKTIADQCRFSMTVSKD